MDCAYSQRPSSLSVQSLQHFQSLARRQSFSPVVAFYMRSNVAAGLPVSLAASAGGAISASLGKPAVSGKKRGAAAAAGQSRPDAAAALNAYRFRIEPLVKETRRLAILATRAMTAARKTHRAAGLPANSFVSLLGDEMPAGAVGSNPESTGQAAAVSAAASAARSAPMRDAPAKRPRVSPAEEP
jgi:hypothetical protein